MQRGLIRERPREQRRPGLLLLDAESAKAVLKGPAQVSLDTYRVVHLPPPLISRVSLPPRRARKGEPWKITIVSPPLWEKHSPTRAIPQSSKVCQREQLYEQERHLLGGIWLEQGAGTPQGNRLRAPRAPQLPPHLAH